MNVEWVTIGWIRKPHGIHGYVKIECLSDAPDRFHDLRKVWLEFPDGRLEQMTVDAFQADRRNAILKFESVDDPEAAARLRGAYIQVRSTEKASLPEGQFYVFELIGSRVMTEGGDEIGCVREIWTLPAHDVYVVDTPRGELLIPAVHDIVAEIDPEHRRVVVRMMPGLMP